MFTKSELVDQIRLRVLTLHSRVVCHPQAQAPSQPLKAKVICFHLQVIQLPLATSPPERSHLPYLFLSRLAVFPHSPGTVGRNRAWVSGLLPHIISSWTKTSSLLLSHRMNAITATEGDNQSDTKGISPTALNTEQSMAVQNMQWELEDGEGA